MKRANGSAVPRSGLTIAWLLCFGLNTSEATAAVREWPGATCATTLQACIDGAAVGDTVEIATLAPIDESPRIVTSLVLRAKAGFRPRFAAGRNIDALPLVGAPSAFAATIAGLELADGTVRCVAVGVPDVTFRVEDIDIVGSVGTAAGIRVVLVGGGGTHQVQVTGNRLRVASPNEFSTAIAIEVQTAEAGVDIFHNDVSAVGNGLGTGIRVENVGSPNTVARVFANRVRGAFRRGAIFVGESGTPPGSGTARLFNNVVVGERTSFGSDIRLFVLNGEIDAFIINNTLARGDGIELGRYSVPSEDPPPIGNITGAIQNNLLASTNFGIHNDPARGGLATNDYNLRHRTEFPASSTYVPGPNDRSSDPQLRSLDAPRPGSASPARDAGNNLALLALDGLPATDGDGLRRLVGSSVDIGAYEFGHRTRLAVAPAAPTTNYTPINDPDSRADATARVFATTNFTATFVPNPRPIGVYHISPPSPDAGWYVFNQDPTINMPGRAAFNVFLPGPAIGLFMHTAAAATITAPHFSVIDNSSINGDPDRFVLLTQNWNGSSAPGIYNDQPTAILYGGTRWAVVNASIEPLPLDAKFNVYSQQRSPNAFVHAVDASNIVGTRRTRLDHPLLNGTPCAEVQVTAHFPGVRNGTIFDVDYRDDRWTIFASESTLALGQRYSVLVVPEQVEDCSVGALFRDGLESPS